MSETGEGVLQQGDSAGSSQRLVPRPMTMWGRFRMIVFLSLLCSATLRTNTYVLGSVLGIPAEIGIPLVPALAALWWIVPLFIFPSLRDVGSFGFPASWSVLLIVPVVILNWCFSMYFLPVRIPWPVWLHGLSHAIAVGAFEELVFRGYAFRRMPLAHPRFVVGVSALCFALVHFPWLFERPAAGVLHQVSFAFVVGATLGIIRLVSGSLAWCMLMHGAINAARQLGLPGLHQWTPCVMGLVAITSLAVLCFHSTFKNPIDPHDTLKCA